MNKHAFQDLLPETICEAVSQQGFEPTGQLFQLNSYENRVYEVPLENSGSLITKFYRPGRWDESTLVDEHLVLKELEAAEVPVVRPLTLQHTQGFETLGLHAPYFYCLYPKIGGRQEACLSLDELTWLGRTLARLHSVTKSLDISHRLELNTKTYGDNQLQSIFDKNFVPDDLKQNLEDIILRSLDLIDPLMDRDWESFAVHGDCHWGNVLWTSDGPTLVDFDDMVIAPPVQDMWMLFFGNDNEQRAQKEAFFEGYETFAPFDHSSFILTEPLRSLRLIRHTAWIGERFGEEIFQKTFPYYTERKYWEEFLLSMKEQLGALQSL